MSDFGSDVGNAGLSAMTKVAGKVMDALLALINKVFETWKQRTSADYKLKKIELKQAGVKEYARKALEVIDGKSGYIAKEELDKAKYPYEVLQSKCSEQQFNRICELCKRSGIIISGMEDVRDKELAGQRSFFPIIASKDKLLFKDICDTVLIENQIEHCNEQKAAILEKGEKNLTDEDKMNIKLYDEKICSYPCRWQRYTYEIEVV